MNPLFLLEPRLALTALLAANVGLITALAAFGFARVMPAGLALAALCNLLVGFLLLWRQPWQWPPRLLGLAALTMLMLVGVMVISLWGASFPAITSGLVLGAGFVVASFLVIPALWLCQWPRVLPRVVASLFLLFEVVVVGQVYISFLFGVGEIHDMWDGVRRAFGVMGDSLPPLLVFFMLLGLLQRHYGRAVLAIIALFMCGTKMALGMALLAAIAAVLYNKSTTRQLVGGLCVVLAGFALAMLVVNPASRAYYAHYFDESVPQGADFVEQNPYFPGRVLPLREPQPIENTMVSGAPSSSAAPPTVAEYKPDAAALLNPLGGVGARLVAGALATGGARAGAALAGLDMMLQNPLIGVGYGQAPAQLAATVAADHYGFFSTSGLSKQEAVGQICVCNQALTAGAEMGLPGLLAFGLFCLAFLGLSFVTLRRLRPEGGSGAHLAKALGLWSIAFVLLNQTAVWLKPDAPNFWLLGIAWGAMGAIYWRGLSEPQRA